MSHGPTKEVPAIIHEFISSPNSIFSKVSVGWYLLLAILGILSVLRVVDEHVGLLGGGTVGTLDGLSGWTCGTIPELCSGSFTGATFLT